MRRLTTILAAYTLSFSVMAQTATIAPSATSTSAPGPVITESKNSLFIINSSELTKNDKFSFNGVTNVTEALLTHKISDTLSATLYPALRFTKQEGSETERNLEWLEARVSKTFLKEKVDGLKLQGQLRFATWEDNARDTSENWGVIYPRLQISKKINNIISVPASLRYYHYLDHGNEALTSDNSPVDRRSHRWRAIISPTFSLTDKFSLSTDFDFDAPETVSGDKTYNFGVAQNINYDLSSDVSATLYASIASLAGSNDGQAFTENALDATSYGLIVSISAF